MGKLKRLLGYSAFLGNRRKLDEQLGYKEIYEHQIEKKIRDWKECIKIMPKIDAEIARLRAEIAKEDAS